MQLELTVILLAVVNGLYRSLSAGIVIDGLWASKDDFLLLEGYLIKIFTVSLPVIVRPAFCLTGLFRWKQLGENRTRGFLQKLDGLVRVYAPELLRLNGNLLLFKCIPAWGYRSVSVGMINDGLWASNDDFLLLKGLLESGACMEEVDWNSLLPHRDGQTCLLRWKQLAKHLGERVEARDF
ncbi:hypothetical protein GOP47_0020782 [Adiantum capillus-veneris]|uniref:Myb-like domain-containing protein n=1 Tax=Adiantum capillus-veneris TaxID=13818 RepID=A0A9D4UA72_ADICA|nr:hypothetical protein GOP47_0020782 [Adiantum capillus-veneris]